MRSVKRYTPLRAKRREFVHHRRYVGRTLHRHDLPASDRVRPVGKTIHQIDECVAVADLQPLADVYTGVLTALVK